MFALCTKKFKKPLFVHDIFIVFIRVCKAAACYENYHNYRWPNLQITVLSANRFPLLTVKLLANQKTRRDYNE